VPVTLLRVVLLAAGLGAWAASGVPMVLTQAPPWAAMLIAVVAAVSVVLLVTNPGNRGPAGFLLVVIIARLAVAPALLTWPQTMLAAAFVAAVVACHSLAGLCAVLPGDGEVAVRALLPGARRLALVTATASAALVIPAVSGAVSAELGLVVLVMAAGAVLAVIVLATSAARRR